MRIHDHNPYVLFCDRCRTRMPDNLAHIKRLVVTAIEAEDKKHLAVCECPECGRKFWHHASKMLVGLYKEIKALNRRT